MIDQYAAFDEFHKITRAVASLDAPAQIHALKFNLFRALSRAANHHERKSALEREVEMLLSDRTRHGWEREELREQIRALEEINRSLLATIERDAAHDAEPVTKNVNLTAEWPLP